VLQEYRLGEIRVTGNKILSADLIRSLLKLDSGKVFNESRLRYNINGLRERYASLGYVRFAAESVPHFDEQQKVVTLTVNIDEGSQYIVGDIKVTEAKILSADLIRSSLGLVSGDVYNESRLRQGFGELKTLYGNLGYVNFIPLPLQDFDEQQKVVNLTVNLDEGSQYTVNRISFTGNTTTPDEVMRRELLLKEGQFFNASLLTLSLSRLSQLGFFEEIKFEDVRITPNPSEPKVDIDLRVREKAR
jgi:outer membrane protein insertion porin family